MESIKQSVADLYGGADAALSSLLRQLEERQDAAAAELTAWRALGASPEAVRVELAEARATIERLRASRSVRAIAVDVLSCAGAWEPEACLIGNVRAHQLTHLAMHVLATPAPADAAEPVECAQCHTALGHVHKMSCTYGRKGGHGPRVERARPADASSERDACETVARTPQVGDVWRSPSGKEHVIDSVGSVRVGCGKGYRPFWMYTDGTLTFVRAAEPRKVEGLDGKDAWAAMEGGECARARDGIVRRMRSGMIEVQHRSGDWAHSAYQTPADLDPLAPFSIVADPSKAGA